MSRLVEQETENVIGELNSDKAGVRMKALGKVSILFNNHYDRTLSSQKNRHNVFDRMFESITTAIRLHARKLFNANEPLTDAHRRNFTSALDLIINTPNILNNVPGVLENVKNGLYSTEVQHTFKDVYLNMLKAILKQNSEEKFSLVPVEHWRDIIKLLLRLSMHPGEPNIDVLIDCLAFALQHGFNYSPLSTILISTKVFDSILKLLSIHEKDASRLEKFLVIAYQCCQQVAVDFRIDMCRFTEKIYKHVESVFATNLKTARKPELFKLIDLTLILHVPVINHDQQESLELIQDHAKWKETLCTYEWILEREMAQKYDITRMNKRVPEVKVDPTTALAAARFCFYYYWNETLRTRDENSNNNGDSETGETPAKRLKRETKLKAVVEKVKPEENSMERFNWNWLMILAELIHNFPHALANDDIHDVLKMLTDCQSEVQTKPQQYAFTKCCLVLLQRDKNFKDCGNKIVYSTCEPLWSIIAQKAQRACSSTSDNSVEAHGLLKLLIYYKKCSSKNSIESVIQMFATNSVIKCDYTLNTLIILLQSFNLDSMPNGNELTASILAYVCEKPTVDILKKIRTMADDKPTHETVAKLAVMCCLLKTDMTKYLQDSKIDECVLLSKILDTTAHEAYKDNIAKIVRLLNLKHFTELIIEQPADPKMSQDGEVKSMPTELKCIIDQDLYEQLMRMTEYQIKTVSEASAVMEVKNYLKDILENNLLMLNLASEFLKFEAFDREKYSSSFIVKKINYNLQEINRLFKLLQPHDKKLDCHDKHAILVLLQKLFQKSYHPVIGAKIRSVDMMNCLKWLVSQASVQHVVFDEDTQPMKIGRESFLKARKDEMLKYLAVTTVCSYFNYDGLNKQELKEMIPAEIEFDEKDNMDVHTVFKVAQIFGAQGKISIELTFWIWQAIGDVIKTYWSTGSNYMIGRCIDMFGDIVNFSKAHSELTKNVCTTFSAFSNLCSKTDNRRVLNDALAAKFLEKLEIFHTVYFIHYATENKVKNIYKKFIDDSVLSMSSEVRMAAIKCLETVLHYDIEAKRTQTDETILNQSLSEVYEMLTESIPSDYDEQNVDLTQDVAVNTFSFQLQVHSTAMCANLNRHVHHIMCLSKLIYKYKLPEEIGKTAMQKIVKRLGCTRVSSIVDEKAFIELVDLWTKIDTLTTIPWYFTDTESFTELIETYYSTILLSFMKTGGGFVDEYLTGIELTAKEALAPNIANVLAFYIPLDAGCQIHNADEALYAKTKLESTFEAEELTQRLVQNVSKVIVLILENVLDNEKFMDICDYSPSLIKSPETIKFIDFQKCLEFIKITYGGPRGENLLTHLCMNDMASVEQIFMLLKKKIQSTELKEKKILYLAHYYILLEQIYEYMNRADVPDESSLKPYLVREVSFYFCFLISDGTSGQRLRCIAANLLANFLKTILPVCASEVKCLLDRIIPKLVLIWTMADNDEMRPKCLEIIKFLILEQTEMNGEIAKLDRFPSDADFDEVRERQIAIKYAKGEYTLVQEIEHFLDGKSESRHAEGIAELRKHLINKKEELKQLFLDRSNDGNRDNSLLHRLIQACIFYANHDHELYENRAIEAVKCLGEIGTHSLSSIVFNIETLEDKVIYEKVENVQLWQRLICQHSLDVVEKLLLQCNPTILQSASAACYELLESASSIDYKPSSYLRPFLPDARNACNLFYMEPKSDKTLELLKTITESECEVYAPLIKKICLTMATFAGGKSMSNLITNNLKFAEMLLPMMFKLLLLYKNPAINEEIIKTINYFFENVNEKLNYSEQTNKGSIFIEKKIIRQMLKLVESVRVHFQNQPSIETDNMQSINYLHIAKAAKYCEAFFSAIQYCELWARKRLDDENIELATSMKDPVLQEILFQSYSAIGNNEARDIFINLDTNRMMYLQCKGLYSQALVEGSTQTDPNVYYELLMKLGMHRDAQTYSEFVKVVDEAQQYQCLWQLSNWDTIVETDTEILDNKGLINYEAEYEKYHFLSLKCCKNDDELGVKNSIHKGRKVIIMQMAQQSFQCSQTLYKFLEKTHRLVQIEDFAEVRFKRMQNSHEIMLKKWSFHDSLPFDYEHYQQILMQRNSIFDTAGIRTGRRTWIPAALQSNLLFTAKHAIASGFPNDAIKSITKVKNLENISVETKFYGLLEEAKLSMTTNTDLAKVCLKQIMKSKEVENDYIIKSHAYRLYGEILAESYSESFKSIVDNYLEKAMVYLEKYAQYYERAQLVAKLDTHSERISQELSEELLEKQDDDVDVKIKEASRVYDTIAKYYDREYEERSNYLKSQEFIRKKSSYEKSVNQIKAMEEVSTPTADFRKTYTLLKRSANLDKMEIEDAETKKKSAARNTVYYYIRSAINSSDDDTFKIFRIVNLTLANFNISKFLLNLVKENLLKIPSYKFIPALPQITVRLTGDKKDELSNLLKSLLEYCALEHPHHTLPLILALRNSYKDAEKKTAEEPRVKGAKELWHQLKKHRKLEQMLDQMEKMSSALIHLANVEERLQEIPPEHPLAKLSMLNCVQCPTIDLPIARNGDYRGITSILKWKEKITLVGGINAPKKISALCSDGVTRPQLLKGKDDMRQDALMMQIFSVVNKFLHLDEKMQKKQARVRTYKVVPLSRRSGILEWCANTMPIGSYLVGERTSSKTFKKGAHEIYRPNDWRPVECATKIDKISGEKADIRLSTFLNICDHIKPVFHHFFDERYTNPGHHYERRFAYTISVAVSSMIGYILGIGDRHVQNILIDLRTAELIHIDFGVAFEQGKCLPHPELIPFRLTRDIIAPMGVSGVDGVFRKACEETLDILCRNERTISTILELLLYDPMYSWTVGAELARRVQLGNKDLVRANLGTPMNEENHETMATRALQRVQSKLKGIAESTNVCYPSVEGHVQYLIQAATNDDFLSRLFRGWQAYL